MIEFLLELGINEKDINNILEMNKDLVDYEEYGKNVEVLRMIGCEDKEIRNIIISNPNFIIRSNSDVVKLIKAFNNYGFTDLDVLFDSNPYLLNLDDFELRDFFKEKESEGLSKDDIIDLVETEFGVI